MTAGLNIPDEVMVHPTLQLILSFPAESPVLTNVSIHIDCWLSGMSDGLLVKHLSFSGSIAVCDLCVTSVRSRVK
jgi:hypothetical protein